MKSRLEKTSWVLTKPVAHRGLHNEVIPENSMAAFKNAVEKGYPIEMDVHLSLDKKLVVFHDDNLARMTGFDADIRDTDHKTLKSLRLKNTDETIPDFCDFLSLVNGKVPLLIEIKQQKQKGIEQMVIDELKNYKGEFVIQSFDPFIVNNFRKLAPEIIRGQLACGYKQGLGFIKEFILKHTPFNFMSKPDFVNYDLVSLPTKRSRYSGLPLICWTVRTEEEKQKADSLGVNYVFENVFN